MEGRWTLTANHRRGTEGAPMVTRGPRIDLYTTVPVVPCDDAAIERAARGLARSFGEEVGFADWRRVAETVLRTAGETP